MNPGTEVAVTGHRYRYSVRKVEQDGSVTCWGPVNVPPGRHQSMRTFKADEVKAVKS